MSAYETVINHSSSSSSSSSEEEVDIDAKLRKIEKLKKRMEEMEAEAASIRQLTNNLERETEAARTAAMLTSRAEADSRSVFVGNVDYACTPEEVQQHFQACGIVNRLTIPTNRYGQPQGYAYIEFIDSEAVEEALQLNESELHGRPLKVTLKRTNIPGNSSNFRRASFRRAVRCMPY